VASTLALGHWWQRQRILKADAETRAGLEILWAVGSVMMGIYWIWPYYQGSALLIATTVAAMVTLIYGLATRAWAVALLGQIFMFISCALVITALGTGHLHWAAALVPIVGLGITSLAVSSIAMSRFEAPQRPEVFNQVALIYRAAACLLFGIWGYDYLTESWRFAFFAIVGSVLLLAGALSRNRDRAWVGALFAAVGTVFFWARFGYPAWITDLVAIVVIPAVFRLSKRIAGETLADLEKTRVIYTGAAVASIWLWTTQWTRHHCGDAMLTVAWALLAPVIFAAGLGLKERIYRVGGFILLGLTVARVFLIDVWKLETMFRIASFLVLGIVLLAVGFVYNRYAETIRKWL
jgi:hypothetical protein